MPIDDIYLIHAKAVAELSRAIPNKIVCGWADPQDIGARVESMARIFDDIMMRLLMELAGDLNNNIPVTSKVDLEEFKSVCSGAFNDLAVAFERVGREIDEDYPQSRQRGTLRLVQSTDG